VLLKEWYSIPKAAMVLGRNKTTIYRLFQANKVLYNQDKWKYVWGMIGKTEKKVEDNLVRVWKKKVSFHSSIVHRKREQRKSIASLRYCRIHPWWNLERFILEWIKEYLSPKQISWRRKLSTWESISPDTIYSYIYSNHPELVSKYFRRKWKKYQNRRKEKYQIDNRRMISRRPKSVERRTTLGHWESDTVVWKKKTMNKKVIVTNVERKSGYLIANVSNTSKAGDVSTSIIENFVSLPRYKRKSITFDNWKEFAYHYDVERETQMTTYFARPYSPRERGTNENTNWLLRQFLPKWSDFSDLTEKELQEYVTLLNNRPRERLWYLTPNEVFHNISKSCVWL